MNYKRLFLNWLKIKGFYHAFHSNWYGLNGNRNLKQGYLPFKDPEYYLIDAFPWTLTDEGGHFWASVDILWTKYYFNYKRKHNIYE
jgi:hypothetical protein